MAFFGGRKWKFSLISLLMPLLLLGSTVAVQTYQEYETWKDHRYGILEDIFAITTAGLEPVPDWTCRDPPEPISPTPVQVKTFWAHDAPIDSHVEWAEGTQQRLPVAMAFQPFERTHGLDQARAYALAHPTEVVLILTDQYYRGPVLNDRLEGFACGNLALVNVKIDCPESIVAHEIGHVLGLGHTPSGLMRARGVACGDMLVEGQSQWLLDHYRPLGEGVLSRVGAEAADRDSDRKTGGSDGPSAVKG